MDVRSDTQRQDRERTHPRDNKSGASFHKDRQQTVEMVRICDEERRKTHSEENVEDGYTGET